MLSRAFSRRQLLNSAAYSVAGAAVTGNCSARLDAAQPGGLADETFQFIRRCARPDGGYAPSPDPQYAGYSDTGLSDLAGVTYAATLAKTMGWQLPRPDLSTEFIHRHQLPDGSFVNLAGEMDPKSHLAVLYNTVQGAVSLRALGQRPRIDPLPVMERFFVAGVLEKLPWYTTSFFPLFYAALDRPFPPRIARR